MFVLARITKFQSVEEVVIAFALFRQKDTENSGKCEF